MSRIGSSLPPQRAARPAPDPTGTPRLPRSGALETLLVDLGSQIQRGSALVARAAGAPARAAGAAARATGAEARSAVGAPAPETTHPTGDLARFHPTGIAALDRRLGGGFPTGRLSEICSPPALDASEQDDREAKRSAGLSTGRTSLALGLLAETLSRGVLAGWVDLADAFDPASAAEAILARGGGEADLDRLLWVRARSEDEAVRSCDRLLQTEGFELVFLDLFSPGPLGAHRSHSSDSPGGAPRAPIKDVTWLRLARLAAGTRTALVVLSPEPLTGSRAELVLEMRARQARFVGPPSLLEAIEVEAVLRRHRSRPTGERVALSIRTEAIRTEADRIAPPPVRGG